ncbi:toxin co-regulated pilus biosynthesis Q family protein [Edwardsiella tarda]|uniref:toxin co-regulated pilus biosynthesis Q family protein n=1 Tax=Edwardsiella tarda TaxID=636 RepID=UPI0015E81A9C|nr:toxin co-regulated pilus biosynthesis Q family protein [Edwardsiella tarda]
MKIIHTSILLPILLGGCSIPGQRPETNNAQEFVDAQININLNIIKVAQKDLENATLLIRQSKEPIIPLPIQKNASTKSPGLLRGMENIKSIGVPGNYSLVSIHARGLTIEEALSKIIPPGWSVVLSADLKSQFKQRVNLDTNDQWPYALNKVLVQNKLVALIDWAKHQVSIAYWTPEFSSGSANTRFQLKQPIIQSPTSAKLAPGKTTQNTVTHNIPLNPFSDSRKKDKAITESAKASSTTNKSITISTPPKVWRIEPGSTLKDSLFNWAASEKCQSPGASNWTVAWLTQVNYRIDAPLQFNGSFRDALNSLFTLYGSAKIPLYAGVRTSQCLIAVDDKEIR